jgi:Family of unknown function (DUF6010)
MTMLNSPPSVIDYAGPLFCAALFVVAMSQVKEPARRTLNAIFAAGATGVYLSGGFGPWELLYPAIATPIVYLGLRSYRLIGLAWLMHACWDILHHFWGNPIWPFMPTSSFGCMIFDSFIAVWFLSGAPAIFPLGKKSRRLKLNATGAVEMQSAKIRYVDGRPMPDDSNC